MDKPLFTAVRQLSCCLFLGSCLNGVAEEIPYPVPDPFLGEELQPGERALAVELESLIEKEIRKSYAPGEARRDAHPKHHGCVSAEFRVDESIPEEFQYGVFQPGSEYRAIIRFSNGDPNPERADAKGDTRGMAIKLLDVPGEKLLEVQSQADTQDFLLISSPYFFVKTPKDYVEFFRAVYSDSLLSKISIPLHIGLKGSLNGFLMRRTKIANPVSTRYWSAVPYQLGLGEERQAVKYSVAPCGEVDNKPPKNPGDNYLRDELQKSLSEGQACMTFMVQPNRDGRFSVENSVNKWSERRSPFITVASINIPTQTFNTPAQDEQCENMSFNPWHSLAAHRPLGSINRMRKAIYFSISALRHDMNGQAMSEP